MKKFNYYILILPLIIVTIFILPDNLKSDDFSTSDNNLKNKYGLKASNISGYGLFYNRKVSQNFYLQFNGLVYYLDYAHESGEITTTVLNYDFGIEIQRDILKYDNFRFYILAGTYYFYDEETNITRIENNSNTEKEKEEIFIHSYNIGLGTGFEYYFYKRVFVTVELGYKFYEDNIRTLSNSEESNDSIELERITKIGASIGIGYTF